jgi:predicted DNA-binding antitoxin AbrB/MazE fold protein
MQKYEDEIWKPITKIVLKNGEECHFNGYDVSNYGRVRTYKQKYGRVSKANKAAGLNRPLNKYPTIINGRPDQRGYIQFELSDIYKKRRNFRSHTLVMQTFVGIPKQYEVVCHSDDIKTNNHISNLRYDTQKANMLDKIKNSKK